MEYPRLFMFTVEEKTEGKRVSSNTRGFSGVRGKGVVCGEWRQKNSAEAAQVLNLIVFLVRTMFLEP